MTQAIDIKNLSYRYPDGILALDDISMEVAAGESVAVIGPNGGGKTTFLLHLNGILTGQQGSVKILGISTDNGDIKGLKRRVGIVFQDPDDQLFMSSVFDDVAFGPINMGMPEEPVREKVKMALDMVGLSGYEDRCSHHLSFGEKKRVSFATILSMEPEMIALDEPTANLDPRSRAELIDIVKKLNKEGKTIIMATHDLNAVSEMAGRIYVLNRSTIASGTTREIFSDLKFLKENDLDIPDVAHLFEVLRCFGYACENLPLSIEEAVDHLTRSMDQGGKHIHLHLHEHTHEELARLSESWHIHHPG